MRLMKFSSIDARYDILLTERQWEICRQRGWSDTHGLGSASPSLAVAPWVAPLAVDWRSTARVIGEPTLRAVHTLFHKFAFAPRDLNDCIHGKACTHHSKRDVHGRAYLAAFEIFIEIYRTH